MDIATKQPRTKQAHAGGRPRKQSQPEQPGFRQQIRAKFINFAERHKSIALRALCTKVWLGEVGIAAGCDLCNGQLFVVHEEGGIFRSNEVLAIGHSFGLAVGDAFMLAVRCSCQRGQALCQMDQRRRDWAAKFNIAHTWIEQWAQDALDAWSATAAAVRETVKSPKPWWIQSAPDQSPDTTRSHSRFRGGRNCPVPRELEFGEIEMVYPLPRDIGIYVECEQRGPTSHPWLNSDEVCPICGAFMEGEGAGDYTKATFCAVCRKVTRIIIPSNLVLKIECAALYHMCGKTAQWIAQNGPQSMSKPNMQNWLNEANALLELKMRPGKISRKPFGK